MSKNNIIILVTSVIILTLLIFGRVKEEAPETEVNSEERLELPTEETSTDGEIENSNPEEPETVELSKEKPPTLMATVKNKLKKIKPQPAKGSSDLSPEELEEINAISEERGFSEKEKQEFKQIWVDARRATSEFDGPDEDPNETYDVEKQAPEE